MSKDKDTLQSEMDALRVRCFSEPQAGEVVVMTRGERLFLLSLAMTALQVARGKAERTFGQALTEAIDRTNTERASLAKIEALEKRIAKLESQQGSLVA